MITGFYAGLLALFYCWLSMQVVKRRRSAKVPVGDGGNAELTRWVRAHGHMAEYVPLTLFLLYLAEQSRLSIYALHVAGMALMLARLSHLYSLTKAEPEQNTYRWRVVGMATNITLIGLLGLYLVMIFVIGVTQ